MQLHVSRSFEFLENHFVHFTTRVNEGSCDDGERTSAFYVASGAEEAFGLLQGIGVDTTGEDFSASRAHGVVGAGETGNRVEENHDVMTRFHQSFSFFEDDAGNFDMSFSGFVKGGRDNLSVDRAGHVGHFFRTFVNEEHHEIGLGMVGRNGVSDILHQDGFTGLGLSHDERALSFSDG